MESSKSEAKLRLGITQMQDELYGDALSSIMKAITLCPCRPASHGKDKSCNISQCIRAVRESESDPDALYRVATGPCSCGFKWPSCSRPLHLEAVDTLAACLEKTKRYTAAFSTALGLIRLDPASPIGYCRITKIIRSLVKNHTEPDQDVTRSLAALLRDANLSDIKKLHQCLVLFVKCGLHNTEKYRRSPDDKYHVILRQIAHNLKLPQSRKDPLTKMPAELINMIFGHLDTSELISCCRVSKVWRRSLEADSLLWARMNLKRPKSTRYFAKFLQRHRTVRDLSIEDCSRLNLSLDKLTAILRLPHLQCLRIANLGGFVTNPGNDVLSMESNAIAPLTKLSLFNNFEDRSRAEPDLMELVRKKASTLEVLELRRIIDQGTFFLEDEESWHGTVFPNLRKLCLIETGHFSLSVLASCAPNLEHLYVDGCSIEYETETKLKSLRTLSVGTKCLSLGGFGHPTPPCLPRTMQVIELLSPQYQLYETFLFGFGYDNSNLNERELPEFPDLEVFRCKTPLSPDWFKQLISLALENGSLKVLELSLSEEPGFDHENYVDDPAKEYPPAPSNQVHTLGLYDFGWVDSYTKELDATRFLDWVNVFPNVKTVTAYPDKKYHNYESTLLFVSRLISHPKIEVIHQDGLRGVEWDQAQELAKARGVKLFHTPGHTPATNWPFKDE